MNIVFPVGYKVYHPVPELNFQINRFSAGIRDEDILKIAPLINNYADWCREMLAIARSAEKERRLFNAACYYRLAEFFISPGDPDKDMAYKKFVSLTTSLIKNEKFKNHRVPYADAYLPAVSVKSSKGRKGTIVLHGGFDSFLEELYPVIQYMRSSGYDVIAFEGPGQGAALKQGIHMTHEWEKPVRAVLDYFKLSGVTLVGLSLGGYLALRAAAHEKRITRVVAYDIMYEFIECFLKRKGPAGKYAMKLLLMARASLIINAVMRLLMKIDLMAEWGIPQGMYVMGVGTPYRLFRELGKFTTKKISRLVTQDVLLMAGKEDHYVPLHQLYRQMKALASARSVTGRIFTRKESAQNHCQVGNIGLALDVILDWIGLHSD